MPIFRNGRYAVTQTYSDMLLIVIFVLVLLLLVASLVTIITVLRRARHPYNTHPILESNLWASLQSTEAAQRPTPNSITPPSAPHPTVTTTDNVTIHIEPDGSTTNEQENIRRIIKHLEKMPKKAAS